MRIRKTFTRWDVWAEGYAIQHAENLPSVPAMHPNIQHAVEMVTKTGKPHIVRRRGFWYKVTP